MDLHVTTVAVTQTVLRYCRGIDRMDAALTLACFEPDAVLKYSGLYRGDPAGFVSWLWPVHAAMIGHTHSVSNVLVDLDADGRVVSESYITVTLRFEHRGEVVDLVGRGRYLDQWRQHDDEWRISQRTYVSDATTVQPVGMDDVSANLPPGTPRQPRITGRRDRDDPSYTLFVAPASSAEGVTDRRRR